MWINFGSVEEIVHASLYWSDCYVWREIYTHSKKKETHRVKSLVNWNLLGIIVLHISWIARKLISIRVLDFGYRYFGGDGYLLIMWIWILISFNETIFALIAFMVYYIWIRWSDWYGCKSSLFQFHLQCYLWVILWLTIIWLRLVALFVWVLCPGLSLIFCLFIWV